MKIKMLLALSLFSQVAFANFNSITSQKQFVEKHAKQTRHQLYRDGYYNVETSTPSLMSLQKLSEYYQDNEIYDTPLTRDEYSKLFSCVKSSRCNLWHYSDYSSMHGGSGSSSHFILFYANSNRPNIISHPAQSD